MRIMKYLGKSPRAISSPEISVDRLTHGKEVMVRTDTAAKDLLNQNHLANIKNEFGKTVMGPDGQPDHYAELWRDVTPGVEPLMDSRQKEAKAKASGSTSTAKKARSSRRNSSSESDEDAE